MLRNVTVFGPAMVAFQLACLGAHAAAAPEPPRHDHARGPAATMQAEATHHPIVAHVRTAHHVTQPVAQPSPPPPPEVPADLSYQEEQVSETAVQNGDQEFLMVDKALGKIILFENGKPVFSGSALTGESTADRLPPGALREKFSKLTALDTKVTPAGRYTVTRGYDRDYGPLLDINEIRGKDWGIAIHQVYVGIPSEHRAERLRSPNDQDKHITFGCINISPEAIRFFIKELPRKQATPLYVLPQDGTKTAAYFSPHNS